jgi:hypothetical protein
MANKPTPAPISKEVPLNEDAVRSSIAAANQRAVAILEQNERVSALALQLNYQGSTDPAVLENSAHDAIRRIGMAIFELGGYLLMLKEACEHGKFLPALERLGMDVDAAQRYMAVSRRFANTASTRHLEGLGITKLVNLLPLDDEQLEDLTGIGQTGELALDDVARMSVKELRAAVRKERSVKARLEDVNKELSGEVLKLKLDKKVVAHTDWPDALTPVSDQVAAAGRKLATALSELETCRITIFSVAETLGDDDRASFEAALAHVAAVYEEALARGERAMERERLTFDKTLGAFATEGSRA